MPNSLSRDITGRLAILAEAHRLKRRIRYWHEPIMSVEDVCELGSLLQSGDEEKSLLERKLIELDGAIQTQDRRVRRN